MWLFNSCQISVVDNCIIIFLFNLRFSLQKSSPPISELMLIAPTQLEVLPVNVTLVMKHGSEIQDAQIMMSVDIPVR